MTSRVNQSHLDSQLGSSESVVLKTIQGLCDRVPITELCYRMLAKCITIRRGFAA